MAGRSLGWSLAAGTPPVNVMRNHDSQDAFATLLALLADSAAIWLAQMLAVWIRFSSGWIHQPYEQEPGIFQKYAIAALFSLVIYLSIFQMLKLYSRPQEGKFTAKIPRLVRANLFSCLGVLVVCALLKNVIPFSNTAILISFCTVTVLVLVERAILFQVEIAMARRMAPYHRALILGANKEAAQFIRAVRNEPRFRTRIDAVLLSANGEVPDADIPRELLCGDAVDFPKIVADRKIDFLVLASHDITHAQTVDLAVFCEQHLIRFSLIPDIYGMMTSKMTFQMVGSVPLVGIGDWPLDKVWNRILKRALDIFGAIVGLLLSAPFVLVFAICIKRESPGPVFYKQQRCGRMGKTFDIYKLRTMKPDAEKGNKPGWTVGDDPRRTKIGGFLRRRNIDELPQFWNVLRGDMSLVGPRPERPYYVERFTPGIEHYMWRHVSKPGLTGWAQVNGYRGDTSISERVKFDLYYLENWSLAFDFKILVRTLFTYKNAC